MESSQKPRVVIYFTILMLLACAFTVVVAVFSILSLRRFQIQSDYISQANEGAAYIQDAQLNFEKMKSYQKNVLIYSGEMDELDRSKAAVSDSRNLIINCLERYIDVTETNLPYQEQDKIVHLCGLIEEYYAHSIEMLDRGMLNDIDSANELMANSASVAAEISDRLSELSMMTQDITMMMWHETDSYVNQSIVTIITLSVFGIILSLIGSIVIARKISGLISDNQEEARYPQTPPVSNAVKSEPALMSELERCVSDLKAVTYDLSKAAKEIRR